MRLAFPMLFFMVSLLSALSCPAGEKNKVFTPEEVVQQKPEGKILVELRVGEVGLIAAPAALGEEATPSLRLSPDAGKGTGDFHVLVLGDPVKTLQQIGVASPSQYFRGKLFRVTGSVKETSRGAGAVYELPVESLDQFERVADEKADDYAKVEIKGRLQTVKSWRHIPPDGLWGVKVQDSYFYFTLPNRASRAEINKLVGLTVVVKGKLLLEPVEKYKLVRSVSAPVVDVAEIAESKSK